MLTLLKLLKDGRFHSGQALGAALGVSRSAVWKQLQHLEAELGLSIHKVRGRGYQLSAPLALLDPSEISARATSCDWPVQVYDSIDSTNAEALRAIERGRLRPLLCSRSGRRPGAGDGVANGSVPSLKTSITAWYCALMVGCVSWRA